jgi:hypothetical protein
MLHHPFVKWEDLLYIDGQAYGTYIDAFQACSRLHSHPQDFYTDPDDEDDGVDVDSESEEDLGLEDPSDTDHPLAEFEAFARRATTGGFHTYASWPRYGYTGDRPRL